MEQLLLNFIKQYNLLTKKIFVGFSGGVDSSALLFATKQLQIDLTAIHINHQISPNSDLWQQHCFEFCNQHKIKFVTKTVSCPKLAQTSLEKTARDQRYQAISELVGCDGVLLLAHHKEDLAETFLLQALRGSGVKGLASMGEVSVKKINDCDLLLARPLLDLSKQDLIQYAKNNNLTWILDESNQDNRFTRNFLRLNIFPELSNLNPSSIDCLARAAKNCATSSKLLDEYIATDYQQVKTFRKDCLDVSKLLEFNSLKQAEIIRYWLQTNNCILPSRLILKQILGQLAAVGEKTDNKMLVHWQNNYLRSYQKKLYLIRNASNININQLNNNYWDYQQPLKLAPGISLTTKKAYGQGISLNKLSGEKFSISFRQGGEVFRVAYRGLSKPLKKIFSELNIPPWERNLVPIFYINHEPVALGHYLVMEGWQAKENEPGLVITLA